MQNWNRDTPFSNIIVEYQQSSNFGDKSTNFCDDGVFLVYIKRSYLQNEIKI